MRIACLIATLDAGGAERVAATLCNAWAAAGHDVALLTFQEQGGPTAYAIDDGVRLRQLGVANKTRGAWGRVNGLFRRIVSLRAALREMTPDVLLCFIAGTNVQGLLAARGLDLPVVITERIHPAYHRLRWPVPLARRLLYGRATALVVQTWEIAQWFRVTLDMNAVVIPNPISADRFGRRMPKSGRKLLVSVGRLNNQKGYDVLIPAFARLAPEFPDWDLEIFGEGPERSALEALIEQSGIVGRVMLPGAVDDIPDRLAAASLYVQPSRYEGFPNALLEALAAGCPVAATDAPGATGEILEHGKYGVLAPTGDVDALSGVLRRLMADCGLRDELTGRAHDAVDRYEATAIAERWIALFDSLR